MIPEIKEILDLGCEVNQAACDLIAELVEDNPQGNFIALVALHAMTLKLKIIAGSSPASAMFLQYLDAIQNQSAIQADIDKLKSETGKGLN